MANQSWKKSDALPVKLDDLCLLKWLPWAHYKFSNTNFPIWIYASVFSNDSPEPTTDFQMHVIVTFVKVI